MAKQATNPFEPLVSRLASQLVETVQKMPEAAVPFGMKKLSREEQLADYYRVRESPAEWAKLLEEHGMAETINYAKEMEKAHAGRDDLAPAESGMEVLNAQP